MPISRNELSDGTLYSHWTDVQALSWYWPNFRPDEFASKGGGEFYWHKRTFDAIQRARTVLGRPVYINSAHRDWLHNIAVGGAPLSAHLFIALDVSTRGHNPITLYRVLRACGFTSFGFYKTFVHVDLRAGRSWYGSAEARERWAPILAIPEIDLVL